MKTILVPLDGSTLAERVLLYVPLRGGGALRSYAFAIELTVPPR